jgi:hypothetical protein
VRIVVLYVSGVCMAPTCPESRTESSHAAVIAAAASGPVDSGARSGSRSTIWSAILIFRGPIRSLHPAHPLLVYAGASSATYPTFTGTSVIVSLPNMSITLTATV